MFFSENLDKCELVSIHKCSLSSLNITLKYICYEITLLNVQIPVKQTKKHLKCSSLMLMLLLNILLQQDITLLEGTKMKTMLSRWSCPAFFHGFAVWQAGLDPRMQDL